MLELTGDQFERRARDELAKGERRRGKSNVERRAMDDLAKGRRRRGGSDRCSVAAQTVPANHALDRTRLPVSRFALAWRAAQLSR